MLFGWPRRWANGRPKGSSQNDPGGVMIRRILYLQTITKCGMLGAVWQACRIGEKCGLRVYETPVCSRRLGWWRPPTCDASTVVLDAANGILGQDFCAPENPKFGILGVGAVTNPAMRQSGGLCLGR